MKALLRPAILLALLAALGCARDPRPIAYDADGCAYCRMQISDPRFGAELVTTKGKVYAFDSIECLVGFYRQADAARDVRSVWVSDYRHPGTLIAAHTAAYAHLGAGQSPMGRGLIAVASAGDVQAIPGAGAAVTWAAILADTTAVAEVVP
jgi:copper chaperone NosL